MSFAGGPIAADFPWGAKRWGVIMRTSMPSMNGAVERASAALPGVPAAARVPRVPAVPKACAVPRWPKAAGEKSRCSNRPYAPTLPTPRSGWARCRRTPAGRRACSSPCRRTSPPGRRACGRWATARAWGRGQPRWSPRQEPDRPPAGPALLHAEGCSGALRQRAQLPGDEKAVQVALELEGGCLQPLDAAGAPWRPTPTATTGGDTISLAANGEQRVDWRVKVLQPGQATVRMKALTDEESDAMQMQFPVNVHGMMKTDSFSGVVRPEQSQAIVTVHMCRRSACPSRAGWKSVIPPRWPAPWSMPCPIWSTYPVRQHRCRRSTASCPPCSHRTCCCAWGSTCRRFAENART